MRRRYLIELKNGKKLGLNIVGSGDLSSLLQVRTDQFQEMVNRILYLEKPKDRKVKDWEMIETDEEWEAIENRQTVSF